MDADVDVIVVGAGPTGLMLACELRLAGIRTTVVDRLPDRSIQSKAGGLHTRTAEVCQLRGLLDPLAARAQAHAPAGGHFAGLPVPLDFTALDTRHPHIVATLQADVEEVLETEAVRRGATVCRAHELTAVDQDEHRVIAHLTGPDGPYPLRARYLVGCDGGRGITRKLIDVPFPGTPATRSLVVSDVLIDAPAGVLPTTRGHFSEHLHRGDGMMSVLSPLRDDVHRFMFGGPDQRTKGRDEAVSEDEIQRMLTSTVSPNARLRRIVAASRFTDASRQVERYRVGRVLLAGDAAHIHLPTGGQGLNLGVQDAFNLGWKLAEAIRRERANESADDVLDSYHTERHPVAARVLTNTRAQGLLMNPADPGSVAMRELLIDWLKIGAVNRSVAAMISATDIRYDLDDDHPTVGARMLDRRLSTSAGPRWFSDLTRDGRAVLLDATDDQRYAGAAAGWADRVRSVALSQPAKPTNTEPADAGLADAGLADTELGDFEAVFVRPDGYVAHLAPYSPKPLTDALTRWFGPR